MPFQTKLGIIISNSLALRKKIRQQKKLNKQNDEELKHMYDELHFLIEEQIGYWAGIIFFLGGCFLGTYIGFHSEGVAIYLAVLGLTMLIYFRILNQIKYRITHDSGAPIIVLNSNEADAKVNSSKEKTDIEEYKSIPTSYGSISYMGNETEPLIKRSSPSQSR